MCFTRVNRLYSTNFEKIWFFSVPCWVSVLLETITFVTCSLHSLYWEYWIFRTYNFTWHAHWYHISTFPLKYVSYGIDDLYIVSVFLRCHHFRDDQKNLLSVQAFTAKACTCHYVQWQEWYIYSEVSLKTKQRYTNNLAHDLLQIPFAPQRKEIYLAFKRRFIECFTFGTHPML